VVADRIRAVAVPALGHGLEYREGSPAERIQLRLRSRVALEQIAEQPLPLFARTLQPLRIAQPLRDHLVMYGGVLPHVQGRKMKAEGVDAAQEPLHPIVSSVPAAVGAQ